MAKTSAARAGLNRYKWSIHRSAEALRHPKSSFQRKISDSRRWP
jgi:hypothetical protein